MEISGRVQLNDFNDNYAYEEKIDESEEFITAWTDTSANWDTFNTTGRFLDDMITSSTSIAETNNIAVNEGAYYLINFAFDTAINADSVAIWIGSSSWEITELNSSFIYLAESTGNVNIELVVVNTLGDRCTTSMKKII